MSIRPIPIEVYSGILLPSWFFDYITTQGQIFIVYSRYDAHNHSIHYASAKTVESTREIILTSTALHRPEIKPSHGLLKYHRFFAVRVLHILLLPLEYLCKSCVSISVDWLEPWSKNGSDSSCCSGKTTSCRYQNGCRLVASHQHALCAFLPTSL